jgi:hypothetical protein
MSQSNARGVRDMIGMLKEKVIKKRIANVDGMAYEKRYDKK